MARMIPAAFDETTTSYAERTLYFHLANHLDDDWTVVHALPYLDGTRPRLREGECDFVLLHPRFGMLVLEAKSGAPRYVATERQWIYDDGARLDDPFAQGRNGAHHLAKLLAGKSAAWREAALPFGYAVAFPDARQVIGELDPSMDRRLLLLEPDLDQVQRRVEGILSGFSEPAPAPRPQAVQGALAVLQPEFRLVPALGSTISAANQSLLRLTENQAEVLDSMVDNPRLVVRGGAGTGKTLLVVLRARQLAAEGRRVLVLCFNRPLGAYLQAQLADCSDLVTAANFHTFCADLVRQAERPLPDTSARDYWDRLLPDAAAGAIAEITTRYDAILVDEAQDFRGDWWLLVEEMLADADRAQLHLFSDAQQDLYGRDGALPFEQPLCVLKRNCRNTAQIAAFARGAIGLADEAGGGRLPPGPEPVIHVVDSDRAEHDAVRRTLHELVGEQGVAPADIVILGCHRLDRSSFASRRTLGNLTVRDADEPPAPNTVRYATVHRFKGLEADCVLLTGMGQPSDYYTEEHWQRFEYVGGSRARVVLHVFRWPGRDASVVA